MPYGPEEYTPTPTPVSLPAAARNRWRRRRNWPEAAVAIVRILCSNGAICALAFRGLLTPEVAAAALGVLAVPGVVGLLRRRDQPRV